MQFLIRGIGYPRPVTYQDQDQDAGAVRFRRGETLSEALGRVTIEQFDIALGIAQATGPDRAVAVHSTRKAIKRLRAMLRLVRDRIPADRYHTDNQVLKLVGAELSSIRDSWVMAVTLAGLLPEDHDQSVSTLARRLEARYEVKAAVLLDNEPHMASIVEQLENAKKRSRQWTILADDGDTPLPHAFATIAPGLERVYRRGRRAMRSVLASPTDTLLHNWRKRAKYLRHQIEALNVLDPTGLAAVEARFEDLTDLLGEDHDLAVLWHRLTDDRRLGDGINVELVLEAVGNRRHELQHRAIELGTDLYAAPTETFLRSLEARWEKGPTF